MGNSSSEHQSRFFRPEDFSNDPSAFRVFVKKRNKFIPGWLKINDEEIVFSRGGSNFQYWSLAHLRRYGYTCSGVFFFESGRRCATGEGLHTFQSHQAERIFHMVQSKIKIEEYARGSRAGSVASGRVNSLVPNPSASSRIHPVQRFSSEGANNEFSPHHNGAGSMAPPPYNVIQETRRAQQNPSPNCPSVVSFVSAYARTGPFRERPRSVVSNIENNIHNTNIQQSRPNPIQGNASSSTLLQHVLHQQQQHHSYPLPQHLNSLAGSASGSCIMNQSYHSALDSGSPWASQQQLDGDIVMEHVLGGGAGDGRRMGRSMAEQQQQQPIRMAVPAPKPYYGHQTHQQQQQGGGRAVTTARSSSSRGEQQHAYVNVELRTGVSNRGGGGGQQQQNGGGGGSQLLNVRELHRTDRSRLEFLSTGPGAFQLPYASNGRNTPVFHPSSAAGQSAFIPIPSSMQHSFHQFYPSGPSHPPPPPPINSPYHHHQQPGSGGPMLMSQSVSGALPASAGKAAMASPNNNNEHPQPPSALFLDQIMSNGGGGAGLPINYALIEAATADTNGGNRMGTVAGGQQQHQLMNNGSTSTLLLTSSTNTMASGGN